MAAPKQSQSKEWTKLATEALDEWLDQKGVSEFTGDVAEDIKNLAIKTNPEAWHELVDVIQESLEDSLQEGKTVEDLWEYLNNENCKIIAIVNGWMRAFKENKEEIDFTEMLKGAEGTSLENDEALNSLRDGKEEQDENVHKSMRKLRADLLKNIASELKDVPPPPENLA